MVLRIRDTLLQAMVSVEQELQENDYKGGWEDSTIWDIQNHLWIELRELEHALFDYKQDPSLKHREMVKKESVDVQAMAMMVADLAGCYPHGERINGREVADLNVVDRLVAAGWDRGEAQAEVDEALEDAAVEDGF